MKNTKCYYCKNDLQDNEISLCEKCTDTKHLQLGNNLCKICKKDCNTYKYCWECYKSSFINKKNKNINKII
jgi:hypothetical protein